MSKRRAVDALYKCAETMEAKGKAYNNFPQAEYYPDGLRDIYYMMFTKMMRIKSLMANNSENKFESMQDSVVDLINYSAFFIEYSEGKMDGMTDKQLKDVGIDRKPDSN